MTAVVLLTSTALTACGASSTQTTAAVRAPSANRANSAATAATPAATAATPAATAATATETATTPTETATTPTAIGAGKGNYPQTVSTATNSLGTYLVGAGRALYVWRGDRGTKSYCVGRCEQIYRPLLVLGRISVSGQVRASDLGTSSRGYGYTQVDYAGKPLYYFDGDPTAGTVHGQGRDLFGARWWLLAPSGREITTTAK